MASQVLCAVATFRTNTIGGTAVYYWTNGLEYVGDGRPGNFDPRVKVFVDSERVAFSDNTTYPAPGEFGKTQISGGEFRVADPARDLADVLTYGADTLELYILASPSAAWSSRKTLLISGVEQPEYDADDLVMRLKDAHADTQKPFETTTYLGTNVGATGVEGLPEDLQAKPIVNALGEVYQVPVPFVNAANLIVGLDAIRIDDLATNKLYDGLVPLTRSSVQTSVANLVASAPGAGTFALYRGTSGDRAYAKLGAVPQYQVTADLTGQARGGTYRRYAGELWYEVLTQRAGIAGGNVSSDDAAAVDAAMPHALGLWIDSEMSCDEVCNMIAQSVLGYWGKDRFGVYRFKLLVDPATQTPAATFKCITPLGAAKSTDGDIISLERVISNDPGGLVPYSEISVLYQESVTVMPAGFDTAATRELRAFAMERFRRAKPTLSAVNWRTKYPQSRSMELETRLATKAGGVALADRASGIFNVEGRARYRAVFPVTDETLDVIDLGVPVEIAWPQYGLSGGKTMTILGVKPRSYGGEGDAPSIECQLLA